MSDNNCSSRSLTCMKNSFLNVWRNITIEPVFLLFMLNYGVFGMVASTLYIDKVCRVNLNFTSEICDHIHYHEDEQIQVQEYASTLKMYNSILQAVPGTIYLMVAGSLSDTYGRKPFIALALLGYVFNNTVFLINSIYFNELKAEYLLFECLQGKESDR